MKQADHKQPSPLARVQGGRSYRLRPRTRAQLGPLIPARPKGSIPGSRFAGVARCQKIH